MKYFIAIPVKNDTPWYTDLGLDDAIKVFNNCLYKGYDVFKDIKNNVPPYLLARRIIETTGMRRYGTDIEIEGSRIFYHEYGNIIYKLYREGESFDRVKNGGKNTMKLEYFLTFKADEATRTVNDMLLYDSNTTAKCINKLLYASTPDSVMELIGRIDDVFRLMNNKEFISNRENWTNRTLQTQAHRVNKFLTVFRTTVNLGMRTATSKGKLIKTRNAYYPELFITACDIFKDKLKPVESELQDICNVESVSRYLPNIGMDLYQAREVYTNLQALKKHMLDEAVTCDGMITLKGFGKQTKPFTFWRQHDDNPVDGMRTSNLSSRFIYWAEKMQRFI